MTGRQIREAILLCGRTERFLRKGRSQSPADVRQRAEQMIADVRGNMSRGEDELAQRNVEELRRLQKEHFPKAIRPAWRGILSFLVLALVASLFVRTVVVAAFIIPTSSMDPTLRPGDMVLVWRSAYAVNLPFTNHRLFKVRSPRRWEVTVFSARGLPFEKREQERSFVKRIVGLPGEEIEIKEGEVYVNGRVAAKPKAVRRIQYISKGFPAFHSARKIKVPPRMYFVLGDNTYDSEDSRFWGFVPEENIRGRAFLVFFPSNRIHSI